MKLNDRWYNVLKWIVLIVAPASCTLLTGLNLLWNWDAPIEAIVGSISLVATFLGTLIGVSTVAYNKSKASEEE